MEDVTFNRVGETSGMKVVQRLHQLALLVLLVALPSYAHAQDGRIAGRVTDQETGAPIAGVQVHIEALNLGTVTQEDGRFLLLNVPAGSHTVRAEHIGYASSTERNVEVASGASVVLNFELRMRALRLDDIVVTGVVDPIEGVKVPFSVGSLSRSEMPVPNTHSALAALQGKVAGVNVIRNSGRPGTGVTIQLRTPTSITHSNTPLYVVDGVILGDVGTNTIDIESLDVENIEVIKGAAASALYGSRAAGGVIAITTASGADLDQGTSRFTVRSEIGTSALPEGLPLANAHFYELNEDGDFINEHGGLAADRRERIIASDRMMDKPYPGETYDNLKTFYRPGLFMTNSVALAHNSGPTNLRVTFNQYRERGIVATNDGFERKNVRLNIGHRISDQLRLTATMYHNRGHRDNLSGSPFEDLLRFDPDVNLNQKDDKGMYVAKPDPLVNRANPLWRLQSRNNYQDRSRTLASATANFQPTHWFRLTGNVSYDRSDRMSQIYVPLGLEVPTTASEEDLTDGRLQRQHYITEAMNASISAQFIWRFGDLNTRTMVRGLMERETYDRTTANATNFWVRDVPRFDVARTHETTGLSRKILANGWFLQTGLDYQDKYIGDLLVRRDGSSLFGPEERWHTYYRASLAYRMGEEDWWPFESITEFKPRYSVGTAGGRPSFTRQYETWSVSSSGAVSKSNLGNRHLKPEHTTEHELGLDMIIKDRFQVELTYATHESKGQILQIPQPAVTGYSNRYENSGTISGSTYELTLQALLHQGERTSWTTTFIADHSKSEITEWNRDCYTASDTGSLVQRCQGLTRTNMHGSRFYTSPNELPEWLAPYSDHFVVNDDGYLVAVGKDGDWRDGKWGETMTIGDETFEWGMPIVETDEEGNRIIQQIGDSQPDLNLGLINQFNWGRLTLHAHLHAQIGGNVYNQTKQRLYQHHRHGDVDQTGKAPERKKPIDYYSNLYDGNNNNPHFVEDGTYLKLREVAARYRFDDERLERWGLKAIGIERMTLGVIARNLLTFTNYSGFDPEVGSVALRRDSWDWPHVRTLTANVEIQF